MSGEYAEALEQLLALQRWSAGGAGKAFWNHPDCEHDHYLEREAFQSIDRSVPYYWSPELCQLVERVAPTLPDFTMLPEFITTNSMYFWFARPLTMPHQPRDPAFAPDSLAALLLTRLDVVDEQTEEVEYQAVTCMPFYRNRLRWSGLPTLSRAWPCGISLRLLIDAEGDGAIVQHYRANPDAEVPAENPFVEALHNYARKVAVMETDLNAPSNSEPHYTMGELQERNLMLFRYVATALTLSNQLLEALPARPPRPVLKRIARERPDLTDPTVRVVQLRRRKNPSENTTVRDVDWTCRWLVSGHWRMQPYPSLGIKQPIFIAPYVKGPDAAPLKQPSTRIFKVTR